MARVKLYFETLAQHHPHDPHRPRLTSAVDFWPALFGIELYNLDAEFQASLYQIYIDTGFPSSSSCSPSSSRSASPTRDDNNYDDNEDDYKGDRMDLDDDDDDDYGIMPRQDEDDINGIREDVVESGEGRRRRRKSREALSLRHTAIDALRAATQRGALEITSRMDALLENAPYTKHAELLRLRAHAALFIGDLYLPSRLIERYSRHRHRRWSFHRYEDHSVQDGESAGGVGGGGEGGGNGGSEGSGRREIVTLREAEKRLKAHLKTPEEHVALARRGEEQERARAFFRRVLSAKGGWLEDWILRSLDEDDEDEEN